MDRMRAGIKAASLMALLIVCQPASGEESAMWERYKSRFISGDGRVIDFRGGRISHSEGQGYAMLLAVAYDDKETFERVWRWTRENIGAGADSTSGDALFAWKWGEAGDGSWRVLDANNATDGDLFIAYALLKASARWDGSYNEDALRIIKSVRTNLAATWHGRTFLLPGKEGFVVKGGVKGEVKSGEEDGDDGIVLNPSYIVLSAYESFAKIDDNSFWTKVAKDGRWLLTEARFGPLSLPADWVELTGDGVHVYSKLSTRFGHDAVRTILYNSRDKSRTDPVGLGELFRIYKETGAIPMWVDLEGSGFSNDPAPAGFYALYARAAERAGDAALALSLRNAARLLLDTEDDDYYSFSLYLLSNIQDHL